MTRKGHVPNHAAQAKAKAKAKNSKVQRQKGPTAIWSHVDASYTAKNRRVRKIKEHKVSQQRGAGITQRERERESTRGGRQQVAQKHVKLDMDMELAE